MQPAPRAGWASWSPRVRRRWTETKQSRLELSFWSWGLGLADSQDNLVVVVVVYDYISRPTYGFFWGSFSVDWHEWAQKLGEKWTAWDRQKVFFSHSTYLLLFLFVAWFWSLFFVWQPGSWTAPEWLSLSWSSTSLKSVASLSAVSLWRTTYLIGQPLKASKKASVWERIQRDNIEELRLINR